MKHLLFVGSICLALILASGAWANPDLFIYYSYDSFGAVVPDESGNGHDGAVVGDVTPDGAGKRGGAAKFTTGSYLDLDGQNIPDSDLPSDAMTLCAWVNIVSTGGDHAIFNAWSADQTWLIHPEVKEGAGEFRWLLRAAGMRTIFDIRGGVPVAGQWMHFAGVYSAADNLATLYINGVEVGTEVARIANASIAGRWWLGTRVGVNADNARPFTGLMDDFCIFKRALPADEVLMVMNDGPLVESPVPDESSLISTWGEIKSD